MKILSQILLLSLSSAVWAQETFPVNGITDNRHTTYAFTHATIYTDYKTILHDATLIIRDGIIIATGNGVAIPAGAIVNDVKGKYIYPSFIEPYGDYGITLSKTTAPEGRNNNQFLSNTKGAYAWNQAIRAEINAVNLYAADKKKADTYLDLGFGTVCSFNKDGIVRGTGCATLLAPLKSHETILKQKVAATYSFDKGSSTQDYPGSLMGCIALVRQTYLDAQWYANTKSQTNLTLDAFNQIQNLPQIFECSNWQNQLRALKIGAEFNKTYILKGNGTEYNEIAAFKKNNTALIVPVAYPKAYDVSDPWDAENVTLAEMKAWEMAPANAGIIAKANLNFAFTTDGLKEKSDFLKNVRMAIKYGLSETDALKALTYTPAQLMQLSNWVGSLKAGMLANFIITTKPVFNKESVILENWNKGIPTTINTIPKDVRGNYTLRINGNVVGALKIEGTEETKKGTIAQDTNKIQVTITERFNQYLFVYESKQMPKGTVKLDAYYTDSTHTFTGTGVNIMGDKLTWQATFDSAITATTKDSIKQDTATIGKVWFPNMAYGNIEQPQMQDLVFRNATVWTNEADGILKNADIHIRNGKIIAVGKNLTATGAAVIDATGKHITAGIIDEHSHIAISGDVNECTQAVTSEVRIGDVVDGQDINIYRQLSGGVTSSHLLHGSCNPVGGQTQLIKLRWGATDNDLKFDARGATWPGFIKFALGENVKQSNHGDNARHRYPQTRMGVEQVYIDAFARARQYENDWKLFTTKKTSIAPRKDLELEALSEILNDKRFITCHSYIQSEINMLMHVADSFHFTVNTFTHILEGYKVADKMKKHGAGASSFSDWWAYKYEVYEAIPYNGKLLHDMGITVAYNSDDAEMARRLNQEAAKAVKFGGVSEEEALKFVTLNPAKLLHVDAYVGSLKAGKDADMVVWSDNPLSMYARALQTYVDGICYYDDAADTKKRDALKTERARIIGKMLDAKNRGEKTQKVSFGIHQLQGCMGIENH